jgi:hypothetical protein
MKGRIGDIMRKDVLKGLIKLGLFAVIVMIAASASAKAQSLQYKLTANIPFDFTVNDKKLPAGKYSISRAQSNNGDQVLQIQSADGHANVVRLTIPVITREPMKRGTVVFHRYGDQYFLNEVWPAGGSTGRAFPQSRTERELAKKAQEQQLVRVGLE